MSAAPHTATLAELLDRSSRVSELLRAADARFRRAPSEETARVVRVLEDAERDLRRAVRAHPDHSYDGL